MGNLELMFLDYWIKLEPGENPCRHRKNIQTSHRKDPVVSSAYHYTIILPNCTKILYCITKVKRSLYLFVCVWQAIMHNKYKGHLMQTFFIHKTSITSCHGFCKMLDINQHESTYCNLSISSLMSAGCS